MSIISNCPSSCTPKIKLFGIKTSTLDIKKPISYDSYGNIISMNLNSNGSIIESDKPKLLIQDGVVKYYQSLTGEYKVFDQDCYQNVYYDVYKENLGTQTLQYSISLKPKDCSKPMIFGNMKLYKPFDYNIETTNIKCNTDCPDQECGLKINLNKIKNNISDYYNVKINQNDPDINLSIPLTNIMDDRKCSGAFYYMINKSCISNYSLNNNGKTIDSIIIKEGSELKPDLTLTNGKIQYLDLDSNSYKDFDVNHYSNIKVTGYDLNILNGQTSDSPYFLIRISQDDTFKPGIFADYVIYPNKSYEVLDVSNDGTYIESSEIPIGITQFLQ